MSRGRSANGSPRCLYLETLPWHEENFPHWMERLTRLGCTVDLYAPAGLHRKDILGHCRLDGYRLRDLDEVPRRGAGYDFVLLNSLQGPGYDRVVPAAFRPLLGRLAELGLPSISVVHEPLFWTDKFPAASFVEWRGDAREELHLHRQGTLHRGSRPFKPCGWELDGDRLRVRFGRQVELFSSRDGGATFVGPEPGHRLERMPPPVPSLAEHLASGPHRLFTLSAHGARSLEADCGDVRWVHPGYFGDFPAAAGPERRIAFPGVVDYTRKGFTALFAAAGQLRRLGMPVYVVGGERETEGFAASPNVRRLRRDLEEHGLGDVVRFTGPLPYFDFLDFVRRSAFVLPLVDETVEGGAYLTKLSSGMAMAIAFGVPMIVSERIAGLYGLELSTSYPEGDLGAGLEAVSEVDDKAWNDMRRRLLDKRDELVKHSLETVSRTLDEIL